MYEGLTGRSFSVTSGESGFSETLNGMEAGEDRQNRTEQKGG